MIINRIDLLKNVLKPEIHLVYLHLPVIYRAYIVYRERGTCTIKATRKDNNMLFGDIQLCLKILVHQHLGILAHIRVKYIILYKTNQFKYHFTSHSIHGCLYKLTVSVFYL